MRPDAIELGTLTVGTDAIHVRVDPGDAGREGELVFARIRSAAQILTGWRFDRVSVSGILACAEESGPRFAAEPGEALVLGANTSGVLVEHSDGGGRRTCRVSWHTISLVTLHRDGAVWERGGERVDRDPPGSADPAEARAG